MTMTAAVARARLARELNDAEISLNDALLKQAHLFASMIAARRDVDVGQFTGQDVLMRLNKAQQELLSSGGGLARVHGRLVDINRETGSTADDCPDDWRQIGLADEAIVA